MTASVEPPRLLLLLPSITSDTAALESGVIGDTIRDVLKEASEQSKDFDDAIILEIALACPDLSTSATRNKSTIDIVQKRLSAIYSLVGLIATRHNFNIEDSNGVDVRVILVAWSAESAISRVGGPCGPLIDLHTLANSQRGWQFAFGAENEEGQAFVAAFLAAKSSDAAHRLRSDENESRFSEDANQKQHMHVAVGGTFDHLHIGHKLLLTMTLFLVSDNKTTSADRSATVGITGDQLLVNKKHAEVLQSWDVRQRGVGSFIDAILNFTSDPPRTTDRQAEGLNGKSVDLRYANGLTVRCTEIQDAFGPTITEEGISALVISGETRSGGAAVNTKRSEKGWSALEILECNVLQMDGNDTVEADFKGKISSTEIRRKILQKSHQPGCD